MVTAKEYRGLALKFYRWAAEAETEEIRDTYLRLARGWTIAALNANCLPARTCGYSIESLGSDGLTRPCACLAPPPQHARQVSDRRRQWKSSAKSK
jgi:hypothetical protein